MTPYIDLSRTTSGRPAVWESGGGSTSTGRAVIWTEPDGTRPLAIYVPRGGQLANGSHALIPAKAGMFSVLVVNDTVRIIKIGRPERTTDDQWRALVVEEWNMVEGEWDSPPPECLTEAVLAAQDKRNCYHCRLAHFIQ